MTSLASTTRDVYERQAATYDAQRSKVLFEANWLETFAESLPPGGSVLDLGCGAGEPIARWLIDQGFSVTGVDFAEAMLAIARKRWPDGDWRNADMRQLNLGDTFDGIVAWGSFFHLTPDEQRICIGHLAEHLNADGSLLVTVGPRAGEVTGTVGGDPVYNASLSPAEYATCLEDHGLRLTAFRAEDAEANFHTVLLARKDLEPVKD